MPSGRTHDRITLWTLPLVGGVTWLITRNSTLTLLACAGFLFGGLMFGPDLDVYSVQYQRWGWLRWIWNPYQGSLRHRSPLSHSPITGTVVRVLYLLVWVGVVWFIGLALVNQVGQLGWTWGDIVRAMQRSLLKHWVHWLAIATGLEMGALSHYVADGVVSTRKRFKKHGWKALKPPGASTKGRSRQRTSTASRSTKRRPRNR